MSPLIIINRSYPSATNSLFLPCSGTLLSATVVLATVLCLAGCTRSTPGTASKAGSAAGANTSATPASSPAQVQKQRTIRTTGLILALQSQSIRVPQLFGSGLRLTVTRIIANGSKVSKDDILAEFDATTLIDAERDAKAKLDDLTHQLDQKKAQASSDDAGRVSQIRSAEADLEKA